MSLEPVWFISRTLAQLVLQNDKLFQHPTNQTSNQPIKQTKHVICWTFCYSSRLLFLLMAFPSETLSFYFIHNCFLPLRKKYGIDLQFYQAIYDFKKGIILILPASLEFYANRAQIQPRSLQLQKFSTYCSFSLFIYLSILTKFKQLNFALLHLKIRSLKHL